MKIQAQEKKSKTEQSLFCLCSKYVCYAYITIPVEYNY